MEQDDHEKRAESSCSMLSNSWTSIDLNSKRYYVKYKIKSDSYAIMFTDLRDIYLERVEDEKQLETKCKEFNPLLEITVAKLLGQIESVFKSLASCVMSVPETTNGHLVVKVSSLFKNDWEFIWTFNLKMQSSESFWYHVTQPLFGMVSALLQHKKLLLDIIDKKDAEIKDYKSNGAVVSRKYIETVPFSADDFNKSFYESAESSFQQVVLQDLSVVFDEGAELYRHVTDVLGRRKRKQLSDHSKLDVSVSTKLKKHEQKCTKQQVVSSSIEEEDDTVTRAVELECRKELETRVAPLVKKKKKQIKL